MKWGSEYSNSVCEGFIPLLKEKSYSYKEMINLLCLLPFKENIENIYSLPVFYLFTKSKKQLELEQLALVF